MKKFLSVVLTLTMLLSLATILTVPTAAVDGEWEVIPNAAEFQPDFDDEPGSLAGYEYTEDGFHTIPTDAWKESSPHVSVQTRNKVDLKEGVYLEIRIDDFTYLADKWFNVHIWDSKGISPGSSEPKYGEGVQELIRPGNSPDANDLSKPGGISGVTKWYIHQFIGAGSSTFTPEKNLTTSDGKPIICMTLTWNGKSYGLDINGGTASQEVIDFMNEKWGGNDSMAYIGFNAQNSNKGGTVEFTILKFGTDKDSATTPMGDDSAAPTNELKPKAPIADASTVPANQPAVFLNADRENSDVKNKIGASHAAVTVNDDFSIHLVSDGTGGVQIGSVAVKHEVSYDIADFPVAIALTKNFCTCGNEDGSCDAFESAIYYICAGDVLNPETKWMTSVLEMSYDSYIVGEDSYLYFYCDFSKEFAEPMSGRINGIRLDLNTVGCDVFDMMFIAFFRTVEEAEAYVVKYVTELGWTAPKETTEEDTELTTEETTAIKTEETIAENVENKTEQTDASKDDTNEKPNGGCASVVGFSAIAMMVAVAAAGVITFRKKRES